MKNYLSWCSVSVNGGKASSSSAQTVCVSPATLPVAATALPGFELGATPWHGTTGDTGSGDPGTVTGTGQGATSTTSVVVGASGACAWVCCETKGSHDCPPTTLCP